MLPSLSPKKLKEDYIFLSLKKIISVCSLECWRNVGSSFIKLEGAIELISSSCLVYTWSFIAITKFQSHGFRGEKLYSKDVGAVNRNHFSARCCVY